MGCGQCSFDGRAVVGLEVAWGQQSVLPDGGVVIGLHGPVHTVQEEFTTKDTKGHEGNRS